MLKNCWAWRLIASTLGTTGMGVANQNDNSLEDDRNWVVANIEMPIGGVPLQMKVSVPKVPVRPRQLLPTFQQMSNAFVDLSAQRTEAAGEKISCQAGCGACCRQLVPIAELEARHLNAVVNALPEERQQEIRRRFEAAKQVLQAAGLLEIVRHPDQFADQVLVDTAKTYFRLGIPCPFLEQESCSIHPDRPLACREYLVTSPASNCSQPAPENIKLVQLDVSLSRAVIGLCPQGSSRLLPYVPLILALEWTAEHPEEHSLQTGPEILSKLIKNLSDNARVDADKPSDEAEPDPV